MFRYFYLLSLLICINISFCYQYIDENISNNRLFNRKPNDGNPRHGRKGFGQGRFRKRRDFDVEYDNVPAQIDVASFMKSPKEESFDESDPYELQFRKAVRGKDYRDCNSLIDISSNAKIDNNEDYSNLDAASFQQDFGISNFDLDSTNKLHSDKLAQGFDNIDRNVLHDDSSKKHNPEKKCVFRNKLPFFSHNESSTVKARKGKIRKLGASNNIRKEDITSKTSNEKLDKDETIRGNENLFKNYKVNKRSYIDQLCPLCKRKMIDTNNLDSKSKRRVVLNKIYTTRQMTEHYLDDTNGTLNTYNNNFEIDYFGPNYKNRKKREDYDRNIERQKELEDLERRVESVSVKNPSLSTRKMNSN